MIVGSTFRSSWDLHTIPIQTGSVDIYGYRLDVVLGDVKKQILGYDGYNNIISFWPASPIVPPLPLSHKFSLLLVHT